jgi:hypothetical protein
MISRFTGSVGGSGIHTFGTTLLRLIEAESLWLRPTDLRSDKSPNVGAHALM